MASRFIVLLLAARAQSLFFVVNCYNQLVEERIDPIVSPGTTAAHVHTVYGGNGLDFTTTFDALNASTCTSCQYAADKSVYWTPKLYFHQTSTNKFLSVPYQGGTGMAIYYESGFQTPSGQEQLNPFPPGLRMLAGDAAERSCVPDSQADSSPIAMSCNGDVPGGNGKKYTHFPTFNCPTSLRMELNFPACWDGKNMYLPGSKHVSYPTGGFTGGRPCPAAFPVPLPGLFMEVGYDVSKLPWGDGQLVWSNGDTTGCGLHGDFFNGWESDVLLSHMQSKTNPPEEGAVRGTCAIQNKLGEQTSGSLDKLPGCNPMTGAGQTVDPNTCQASGANAGSAGGSTGGSTVSTGTAGGKDASAIASSSSGPTTLSTMTAPKASSTPPATKPASTASSAAAGASPSSIGKMIYLGCAKDPNAPRALSGADWTWSDQMTNSMCVSFCSGKGYKYAGTEYFNQCFCGNAISASNAPGAAANSAKCNSACKGDASQMCGGPNALSLWGSAA